MNTPTQTVDSIIARLDELPAERRRASFFSELEALQPHSRERLDLVRFRPRFAPGPYAEKEWRVLASFSYPVRQYTPAERDRLDVHAQAVEELEQARFTWQAAVEAERVASRKARDGYNSNTGQTTPPKQEHLAALVAAREARRDALELFEQAQAGEVAARPHQQERRRAAGRNWLRQVFARRGR